MSMQNNSAEYSEQTTTHAEKDRHFLLNGEKVELLNVGSSDLHNIMKLGYAVNMGSHCGRDYWQILTDADGLDELENALNNIDAWVAGSQAVIGYLISSADLGEVPKAVINDIGLVMSGLSELQQAVHCANDVVRVNVLRAVTQKANKKAQKNPQN